MRFAGTRMESFMGGDRPDFSALAQKGLANRTEESTAATDLMGKTAATGISEAGKVEAANIVGAAQASLASAQAQGSMFSALGQIGGAAIGAFGSPGIGTGASFGQVGTSGSDMASFGYTPAQDRAFHNGTGIEWSSF